MKIPCPACAAKYSVADDKIQSRLAKIRCRKCGVTIVIDGTVSPISVYVGEGGQKSAAMTSLPGLSAPAADSGRPGFDASPSENGAADPAGPSLNEYAVDIADNDQRNMNLEAVVTAYNAGLVTAETYVWKEGMADWQMLAEVPEIYSALHAAARNTGSARNSGGAFGRQPGSPDLFGGIDAAGTEHDLGASSQDGQYVAAGTGARNESSVLFSLSALTGPAIPGSPGGGKAGKGRAEDSGLIDLQALTAASESAGAAYAPQHHPQTAFGGSALISAPLGGVSSSTMNGAFAGYSKRSSSKTGFIVGGATFVLLAAIGAFVFVMKSGDASVSSAEVSDGKSVAEQSDTPTRRASKASAQAEPEPEQPAATPEPESATAEPAEEPAAPVAKPAKPTAQAVAEPAPIRRAPAPAPRRTTPASLPKPAAAPVAENPKPAAAPAAPAAQPAEPAGPKKKKACDCKPADLMCAMRCSASK